MKRFLSILNRLCKPLWGCIVILGLIHANGTDTTGYSSNRIRDMLKAGIDSTFRTVNGENLLHLAVKSGDKNLFIHVDSIYPSLRSKRIPRYDFEYGYGIEKYAVRVAPFNMIVLLDSLGFDLKDYYYIPLQRMLGKPPQHPSVDDTVCAYLLNRFGEGQWPWCSSSYSSTNCVEELFSAERYLFTRGYMNSSKAIFDLFGKSPERITTLVKQALNHYGPGSIYDTVGLSIMSSFRLPANDLKGHYFLQAVKRGNSTLVKGFIKSNAVINDMSVHNGCVMSPLTLAAISGDSATLSLLKNAGATDSIWYELLVPGYWPSIANLYKPGRTWYSVIASGDSVYPKAGPLNDKYFRVQREDYWKNMKDRALFFIATNKAGGIRKVETVISRPTLLRHGDTLRVNLSSGQRYVLSVPKLDKTILILQSGSTKQDFLNYYSDSKGTFEGYGESGIWVNWAGDLDEDGKLDLLISGLPAAYGSFENTFYLAISSLATKNLLVGWADEVKVYNGYNEYARDGHARNQTELSVFSKNNFFEKGWLQ